MLITNIIKQSRNRLTVQKLDVHKISILSNIAYKVSSRKFHELAQKFDKNQIIHPLFQDNLITKYLGATKNSNNQNINNNNIKNNLSPQKQQHSQKLVNYNKILSNSPRGSIIQKTYKDSQLCMMGMNYTHTSYENIYKTLIKFQPDCILVQNRPQLFCQGFVDIKKDQKSNVFSDKLYVEQLDVVKNGKQGLMGMLKSEEGRGMLEERIFPRRKVFSNINNNKTNINKNILSNALQNQLVQQKPLLASIYHSLYQTSNNNDNNNNTNNNKTPLPIFLTQLPQRTTRQWVSNTNTLMQLQQIFKQVCKSLPLYPATNITPYQLACYMFPQQFLGVNDKYMATMVQVMLALGYKKVMMFCAVGENEAVWEILQNSLHCEQQTNNIIPLIQSLIPPQVKGSMIRNYDPLQLIQKHILLDTLYYGNRLTSIPISKFTTTNEIINNYGRQQPKQMLFKFRYQMCLKYSQLLEECVRQGQERKRKEFMRAVIRQ